MPTWKKVLSLASVIALASVALAAQDPAKFDSTHYKVLIDNASVRVLKVTYAAGAKSTMHSHPEAIVVSLAASKVRFTMGDGKSQDEDLSSESALYKPAGSHIVTNIGPGPIDAVLVEFKALAPGKAAMPASRPNLTLTQLVEGARGAAFRVTADAKFAESPGSTHEYDQVIIALGPAQMPLSIQGKLAKTNWARGDAAFVRRGVQHAAQNTGGKPVDFVVVAVR